MASILTVDDSTSLRAMVAFTLRRCGHEVIEAVDGEDALDRLRSRRIDLVLTDQNMPRMDGLTLVRRLRERESFRSTPILVLSAESSAQMKQAGRAAGATGWLVKPFDPERLVEVVNQVVA